MKKIVTETGNIDSALYKLLQRYFEGEPTLWKLLVTVAIGSVVLLLLGYLLPYLDLAYLGGVLGKIFEFTITVVKFIFLATLAGVVVMFLLFWFYVAETKKKKRKIRHEALDLQDRTQPY